MIETFLIIGFYGDKVLVFLFAHGFLFKPMFLSEFIWWQTLANIRPIVAIALYRLPCCFLCLVETWGKPGYLALVPELQDLLGWGHPGFLFFGGNVFLFCFGIPEIDWNHTDFCLKPRNCASHGYHHECKQPQILFSTDFLRRNSSKKL